ncbi:Protein TOXD [Talaromyces islandicus]|uniref:Protein TOXD n=1 Tax=Talaromyces islandicus TaxID=28573 RepID=A0A0U1M286_TALIS|nr:Protein TOXD [Talaromyces islandicus]
MKALVWNGTLATVTTTHPIPDLPPDYLLIQTIAVALNPTDAKAIAQGRASPNNGLLGSDFAGIVQEVGPLIRKPFRVGDRVCGVTHGGNSAKPQDGAFAEYIVAKGDTCIRIPDHMGFEEAATIGVSAITDGQGMFQAMGLALPAIDGQVQRKEEFLLVYGGSSSTGTLAIQFGKLAGYTVLTTCNPKNFALVKSRGAEMAFDYNDPTCGQQIHDYTHGQLKLIFDTIGNNTTGIQICEAAFSKSPTCRYGTLLLNDFSPQRRPDVVVSSSVLMTFRGEAFDLFGRHFPASNEDFEFASMFAGITERLLEDRLLVPHPVVLGDGGLRGVVDGLELVRDGKVSGGKLVYRVADT